MTARAVAAAGNCNTCGLPIDKATIVGIDGVDLPIVMSVKDRHGVHHYNCWQGFAPQQTETKMISKEQAALIKRLHDGARQGLRTGPAPPRIGNSMS